MDTISYRCGYKYQLAEDFELEIPILPEADISTRFIKLTKHGLLTVRQDFAWDGPSGPTADTPSTMRAGLVHDAIYGLIRDGHLEHKFKPVADRIFYNILLIDGVFPARAQLFYRGVQQFGEPSADPKNEKPVMTAPTVI